MIDLRNLYERLHRELTSRNLKELLTPGKEEYIRYDLNYQRNYIWNITKAVNLIETVLINGVIPPLTIIKRGKELKVIDGRQRYETLLSFYNNEFKLEPSGLSKLKDLAGLDFKNLPENMRTIFEEYELRIILYTADSSILDDELPMLERDSFRRYNAGMTPLKKEEISRAKYDGDFLTGNLAEELAKDIKFYQEVMYVLLPVSKREKLDDREKINSLLVVARELLVMPYMPIIGEKTIKVGMTVFDRYYEIFIVPMSEQEKLEKIKEFERIIKKIYELKKKLYEENSNLKENILFFKSVYWMFSILYRFYSKEFFDFDIQQFYTYVQKDGSRYFDNYKNMTSSNIESRHAYVNKYLINDLKLDTDKKLSTLKENRKKTYFSKPEKIDKDKPWLGIERKKQVKTNTKTFTIEEIINLKNKKRFIIRPRYQRAEVKSKKKASKIIESIILGVKLPPIYVSIKEGADGLEKYTVLDGQQRLISILSYMGEDITDDKNNYIKTSKNKYVLCGLKNFLDGKLYEDDINELNEEFKEKIRKYKIEAITIDEKEDINFNFIDMFIRLNQNPCPISYNSFEMWNSFDIVNSLNKIKEVSKYKLFKQLGNKMKEEELVTTLAYMDYEKVSANNMDKFFTTYIFLENKDKQDEHYEIKLSISNKNKITNFLEDMRPNSNEERKFLNSIESVNEFSNKLKILSNENEMILLKIFNPNIKKPRIGNKKDFYLTWMILKDLDIQIIKTYREEILKDLERIFKTMKHVPNGMTVDDFKEETNNIINKYSRY